jgi:hypothetical protein
MSRFTRKLHRPAIGFALLVVSIAFGSSTASAQLTDPTPVGGTSAVRAPRESVPDASLFATAWDVRGLHRLLLAAAYRWTDRFGFEYGATVRNTPGYALKPRN